MRHILLCVRARSSFERHTMLSNILANHSIFHTVAYGVRIRLSITRCTLVTLGFLWNDRYQCKKQNQKPRQCKNKEGKLYRVQEHSWNELIRSWDGEGAQSNHNEVEADVKQDEIYKPNSFGCLGIGDGISIFNDLDD
eukprot:281646_1